MKIYLVGFMGAGKSTVGRLLAEKLGYEHIDIDKYIEQSEGCCIAQIFEKKGEEYFRNLESQKLRELSEKDNLVISTGGGLGAKLENMEFMKSQGTVVWLDVHIDTVFERCKDDDSRPLLKKGHEFVRELYEKRKSVYSLANIHIDTNHKYPEVVVGDILLKLFVKK